MLQIQKKQNYNFKSINKTLINKSLVALFAIGLFAVLANSSEITHSQNKKTLLKPVNSLSNEEYDKFILGKSFFRIPWVEAPSATTARDGLGPLFNANTCNSCHPSNGRGNLYNEDGSLSRSVIPKLSIPSKGLKEELEFLKTNPLIPEPTYGGQIAINGTLDVKFEAKPEIKFEELKVKFPDGEVDTILKPTYVLNDLQYGELHKDTIITFRIAPSLNGLGLIEDIPDEQILANADEFDKNKDGISGRVNYAYSPITKKKEIGKYSWKANNTSLVHQTADAAINDMGLTTTIFTEDRCTDKQIACKKVPKARHKIDLPDNRLHAIDFYIKKRQTYTAPKDDLYKKGLKLFKSIGCADCHKDSFTTKSGINISPFTDLLLHDMGEGLADGRTEFNASGSEWKTPALWGLSLHEKINGKKPRLLHDGRARTFQEAILWHGGEAETSKEAFMNLQKEKRKELLQFLERL
ncbi:thiol oxidoreductase [Arcobacter sp. CECT 8983]|uniref:di-heme oxidoredictase family protein n=1 Tax=Arcobacter sp. CECT 8983 TaxID=2044508 RepID=UPI00100BB589|nr:di-heme oxidoredictase family protein [Arcobacter sp. CECT 8983]RXJ88722.1 thiol oxidoreductase [Arcobacter sp. CECT 8983]